MDTDRNWHLKKELNIGHILTTLTLVVGILLWGNTMSERLAKAETMIESMDRMITTVSTDNREMRAELIQEIRLLRQDINTLYRSQQQFIKDQNGGSRQ